jgi:hypothetical protein
MLEDADVLLTLGVEVGGAGVVERVEDGEEVDPEDAFVTEAVDRGA